MAVRVVTAAHTPGSAWLGDLNTEVVPEATGAQRKAPDGLEGEDDERLLALLRVAVKYEQQPEDAGCLASCHSLMRDESDNKCSFRRHVQSLLAVLRT